MKYRSEIDGLRALAVLPVIFFHAGFEFFSGGFVGVDIFFVISGYLITTILISDIENKSFSIVNFYERRARRILPALFFVMIFCIPFAWMWMRPGQLQDFYQSLMAVSLFLSNISFWQESDYFAASAELKPLLHTWSLAVEEQYYILFPIFLTLVWRFGKNRVFWVIFIMGFISLLLSEWGWRNAPSANFYLLPTRAWELFAGSLTAFIIQKEGVRHNNTLATLGLAAILFSIFFYDESIPFPSLYSLLPVLGVMLLILYANNKTFVAKILSLKPFVGIGLISYSAYLWHQPLIAFTKIRIHEPSQTILFISCILSIVLAYFTWQVVERPFRGKKPYLNKKYQLLTFSIISLSCFFIFGFVGKTFNGSYLVNEERSMLSQLDQRIIVNHGIGPSCVGEFTLSSDCANDPKPEVLLWGDSFAMHLYQGLVASNKKLKIRQITKSSCSPIIGISRLDKGRNFASDCIEFNNKTYTFLKNNKSIEFVILSSPFSWPETKNTIIDTGAIYDTDIDFVLSYFRKTVQSIHKLGLRVVVVSPTPLSGEDTGDCLVKKYQFNDITSCNFSYSKAINKNEFISKVPDIAPVYWLKNDICKEGLCYAEIKDNFIYRDWGHLSKEGSEFLGISNKWYYEFKELAFKKTNYDY